jgi:hypothetical protein
MSEVLQEKAKQCKSFRDELRRSFNSPIFHSTYAKASDYWWTTGLDHWDTEGHYGELNGFNVFGKQLEYVRGLLKDEAEYDTHVEAHESRDCVYVTYDGEKPIGFKSEPRKNQQFQRGPPRRRNIACYYCGRSGHAYRSCWTKNSDEYRYGSQSIDDIRDPVARSRMRAWRKFYDADDGQNVGPRTFYGKASHKAYRKEPGVDDLLSFDLPTEPSCSGNRPYASPTDMPLPNGNRGAAAGASISPDTQAALDLSIRKGAEPMDQTGNASVSSDSTAVFVDC